MNLTLNLSPTRSCHDMGLDLPPVGFLTFHDFSLPVPKSCHKMTLVTSCHCIPLRFSTCRLTCLDMLHLVTTWVYFLLPLDVCLPREILSAHVHVPPMCLQCVSLFLTVCLLMSDFVLAWIWFPMSPMRFPHQILSGHGFVSRRVYLCMKSLANLLAVS